MNVRKERKSVFLAIRLLLANVFGGIINKEIETSLHFPEVGIYTCKRPILTSSIGKAPFGRFPLKVLENRA